MANGNDFKGGSPWGAPPGGGNGSGRSGPKPPNIDDVIEKPRIKDAPSNKAIIGRYILPKNIFSKLKYQKKGKGGEIHITDAIQSLIFENNKFIGHNFAGKYLDCGTMNGYIKSTIEISKI